MRSNSLTENDKYDIPHYFCRPFLDCMPQLFSTPICVVSNTFVGSCDPKLSWSISRTNCLIHSTRVNLYSHQFLLVLAPYRGPFYWKIFTQSSLVLKKVLHNSVLQKKKNPQNYGPDRTSIILSYLQKEHSCLHSWSSRYYGTTYLLLD